MNRGTTLLELIVVVTVVLILASFAIAGYRQVVDNTRQTICATNEAVIMGAIKQHFISTGVSPASLGQIKPEYLYRSYVEVMQNSTWWIKFSYFFEKLNRPNNAYAELDALSDLVDWEKMKVYGLPLAVFQCPADKTPPPAGTSYGINANLRNYTKWKDIPNDEFIVGDCESHTFTSISQLDARHLTNFSTRNIAQAIQKSEDVQTTPGNLHSPGFTQTGMHSSQDSGQHPAPDDDDDIDDD